MITEIKINQQLVRVDSLRCGQMFIDPEDGEYNIIDDEVPAHRNEGYVGCILFDPKAGYVSAHEVPCEFLVHLVELPEKRVIST